MKDDKEQQKAVIQELLNENAKLNAIIDGYQPRLQALKVEIAELQAYKDVNEDFKTAWEELKAENERLKEKIESYVCSQNCYAYKQADKYRHILQEIKEICKNSHTSASEDYYRTSDKIIQKITKVGVE